MQHYRLKSQRPNQRQFKCKRQGGFALVVALMIVTLVTALAVELSWRFNLSLIRSANRWYGVQADAYLKGAEEIAIYLLETDFDDDQKEGIVKDTFADIWATPIEFPTDEGWLRATISDAQGRFNLNSLAEKAKFKAGDPQWKKWTAPQRRFIRLLQVVNLGDEKSPVYLDQATAINITEAVVDWLDTDSAVTGFGGAESDYYGRLEPPFIIRNGPMISVSELNIIRGMTPQLYQRLLPLVIALPDGNLGMNVNTMLPELIRTIAPKKQLYPSTVEDADLILEEQSAGYDDLQSYMNSTAVTQVVGNGADALDQVGLAVASNYFICLGETAVGETARTRRSLILREGENIEVQRRTDANF